MPTQWHSGRVEDVSHLRAAPSGQLGADLVGLLQCALCSSAALIDDNIRMIDFRIQRMALKLRRL